MTESRAYLSDVVGFYDTVGYFSSIAASLTREEYEKLTGISALGKLEKEAKIISPEPC